ncbi:3-isopropylmalate dehydratase large subunit [Burkholderia multivorans]|uniref:3-isopropylmalate dehydratase large subunit n=1 Tax=Burkholderia multivorans TaxID=87883 RepID=UPI0020186826|nr:3-isopropylmalate dehydratase large subunit [Burkholderia multivorans]MCO1367006.1 3-isopropylmalate dehydratase large subunit [Burkholderia multivorans]MCO1376615.1 3-isopropylmalate dehydratase large subunit [Burkholderia multivorans]UQP18570.1 3-isopropylmalate dehydratase large subunit [Burkholderia multivorans]UQP86539.1 3-isopropylmalate dehydratase large subunit [Burkholderia multivorans]
MSGHAATGRTLYDRIWSGHAILEGEDGQTLLHVGRHIVQDGSNHAFAALRDRGLRVRHPDQMFATPDHGVSSRSRSIDAIADPDQRRAVGALSENASAFGIVHFGLDDARQGIVHVVGPEQGITQPGITLVCGDSHTSTHGALGALAFGLGSSDVLHVLATQTIWQRRSRTLRVSVDGTLPRGVAAKDVILAIIARIGANGAAGHVIEYAGSTLRAMSIEARLTVCNMSIEAGARAGMVSPDDTTYAYLAGRPFAPHGEHWDRALAYWRTLPSDADAVFDRELALDATTLAPMVTWGNSPEDVLSVEDRVPDPADERDPERRAYLLRTLAYMGLTPGMPLTDIEVDQVFIGSCTNARIEDLRVAARVVRGARAKVPARVVPGSTQVKLAAEAEGLDRIFRDAGFEWGEAGCSMCVAMNGDRVAPGQRCVSTSNRNFVGRQGPGSRTHLVSPAMAAAAALYGRITDVRRLES